jgi:tetratricopeptide (TPR) repeat protein
MHIRFCFSLLFALSLHFSLFGQFLQHYEKYALGAYHSKNYSTALLYSQKVLEIDSQSITSLFIAGEAAKNMEKFEMAEMYLEKIPDNAKIGYFSAADFELAVVKRSLRKYDEAVHYFKKYLSANKATDDLLSHYAEEELKLLEGMSEDEKAAFIFRPEALPDNINTEYVESAPLRYADKIFFTSAYKADDKAPLVSRIYEAIQHYPARLVSVNPKDGSMNASNISLMPDASRMYYTLCEDEDYRSQNQCGIWFREREYEGSWGPPKKLPAHINLKGYTTTQPSIGWDNALKKYVLYFVSDRPGGKGKLDIWASHLDRDGTFAEPVNLPFNTPEDDVTPFFHQFSQTLFFSTNGLQSMGGLDIFRTTKKGPAWSTPENLGELVNSSYDDLYYTYHSGSGNAYFSSGRFNASPRAKTRLDNDLYEAHVFVDVKIQALDSLDLTLLKAPGVKVEDLTSNNTGFFSTKPDETQLVLRLESGKAYRMTLLVAGYKPEIFELNTVNFSYITEILRTFYLSPQISP